jgi:N utilization substance protein B
MLYRRHLRIKAFQALYAWYSGNSNDLAKAEKQLLLSVNKLYELFIYQLSFLIEVKDFALMRMEENKKKFYPTEEDLNPNLKFVENRVLNILEKNIDYRKKAGLYKVNWGEQQEMIRKFYKQLQGAKFYKEYMESGSRSLEEDKRFLIKSVDRLMSDFELLRFFYEEKSVYYTDGYDLVTVLLIKFLDSFSHDFNENSKLPGIFKTTAGDDNKDSDEKFLIKLFRETITTDEETTGILKRKTHNWDYERIPLSDLILLKMAIVEFTEMETIPVKVTLNEYIELSKFFSTPKSKIFVNGVLDRLIYEFRESGKIKKSGRGLIG